MPGIGDDHTKRLFERAPDDVDADLLVPVTLQLKQGGDAAHQCHATAGHDALLDSRLRGVHGILDASFLFLHFGLGRRAHLNLSDAANQLRQSLLELFTIVIGRGVFDLRTELLHPAFDVGALAGALDDGGVVLVDGDLLGAAQVLQLHVLKLDAQVLGNGLAVRQDGDVFEHGLAAIAKARRLHRAALAGSRAAC